MRSSINTSIHHHVIAITIMTLLLVRRPSYTTRNSNSNISNSNNSVVSAFVHPSPLSYLVPFHPPLPIATTTTTMTPSSKMITLLLLMSESISSQDHHPHPHPPHHCDLHTTTNHQLGNKYSSRYTTTSRRSRIITNKSNTNLRMATTTTTKEDPKSTTTTNNNNITRKKVITTAAAAKKKKTASKTTATATKKKSKSASTPKKTAAGKTTTTTTVKKKTNRGGSTTTTKNSKSSTTPANNIPLVAESTLRYWNNAADEFIIKRLPPSSSSSPLSLSSTDNLHRVEDYPKKDDEKQQQKQRLRVQFTVRGNPSPLQRHRTYRNFVYNPSASKQEEFRDAVISMMERRQTTTTTQIDDDDNNDDDDDYRTELEFQQLPLYPKDTPIAVTLLFRMKRPKSHFIASRPGPDRLKPKFATTTLATTPSIRSDVDNLAKLVLDSLNGVLYDDDRQVVSLRAVKVMDWEGCCVGATDVVVEGVPDDVDVEEYCRRLLL